MKHMPALTDPRSSGVNAWLAATTDSSENSFSSPQSAALSSNATPPDYSFASSDSPTDSSTSPLVTDTHFLHVRKSSERGQGDARTTSDDAITAQAFRFRPKEKQSQLQRTYSALGLGDVESMTSSRHVLTCAVRQSRFTTQRTEVKAVHWAAMLWHPRRKQKSNLCFTCFPRHAKPSCSSDIVQSAMSFLGKQGFHSHYKLGKTIGEGAYGAVRQCSDCRTGAVFACKTVRKSNLARPKDILQARMEFLNLRQVSSHPNIVGVMDLYKDEKCFYLIMEHCNGGDLFSLLEKAGCFTEEQAKGIFSQILSAVRFCHKAGIMHRDIKLENILISKPTASGTNTAGVLPEHRKAPRVKLGDFGTSIVLPAGQKVSGRTGGSKMYQAPEVLSRRRYDYKADIWSLGVMLFTMLSGSFPFTAPNDALMTGMIKRGVYALSGQKWKNISDHGKDIVQQLLQPNPCRRPSADELSTHPWLIQDSVGRTRVFRTISLL